MNVNTISKVWGIMEPHFQREFSVSETFKVLTHNRPIWWSWGVNKKTIKNLNSRCLMFKVQGRLFKGFVCITLGWEDLYQVRLITEKYTVKKEFTGIYFDELVQIIDDNIESVP